MPQVPGYLKTTALTRIRLEALANKRAEVSTPLSLHVPAALHALHPTQSPLHWPCNVCCWSA